MATLTIEVDQDELSRATEVVQARGKNLQSELADHIAKLARSRRSEAEISESLARLREAFRLADENATYLEGGIPDREERNAR